MEKCLKDILPDKDPYHNRGRDQMRKKGVRNSSACEVSQEIYFYYYIEVSRNVKEKGEDRSVHQIYDCIL
jgi:hypothetical protein